MAKRSVIGTVIETIPAFIAGSAGASLLYGLSTGTWAAVAAAFVILYLVPPLLHRAHDVVCPLKAGSHDIVGAHYEKVVAVVCLREDDCFSALATDRDTGTVKDDRGIDFVSTGSDNDVGFTRCKG